MGSEANIMDIVAKEEAVAELRKKAFQEELVDLMERGEEARKIEEDMNRFSIAEDLSVYRQFKIRPDIENRFQSGYVREEIQDVLHTMLKDKNFSEQDPGELTKLIANTIRNRIGGSGKLYNRYKLVVHVVLGEHKGAGVKSGARCLWDPECDTCVTENFLNDNMFCVATVFGILFY
ncbi:tctex1 domain-containing protein 2-like isoform X2 [Cimex lectularius]|uniref:Dynein light chain n=1 Tax=Cimex lectularius TaxID=79782 RepID=A0A8I6RJ69_CIMLE|nr:tctex1 domain-containing protein 2-like isoform X2 [Cimex lectularius]